MKSKEKDTQMEKTQEELIRENAALRELAKELFEELKLQYNPADAYLQPPEMRLAAMQQQQDITKKVFDALYPDKTDLEKYQLSLGDKLP